MRCSRRDFLVTAGCTAGGLGLVGRAGRGEAEGRTITASHSVSTFVYGPHLVAREKKFYEAEGVRLARYIVPGGGAKVVRALAAGQAMFALGDASHPLKIIEQGGDARIIFATDSRCSYANVVVRRDLWDRGVTSVEALADRRRVGRKAIVAATAIGSGTYLYGVHVLKGTKAADGTPVNAHVEWVGGGASVTMLGGLKDRKFDAIMAVPEWQWAAEGDGFGRVIYDVRDERAWTRVFGGSIPVTVGYALGETVERAPDLVQAYVNANYRAQQWIRAATDEAVVELLHRPYLDAFTRAVVARSVAYYRTIFDWDFVIEAQDYANGMRVWAPLALGAPIPYARAVDMSFVKAARATDTSRPE
jgi:NitT/TauT family transport system substrate-binding protein